LSRFATPSPPALLTGLLLPGCEGAYDIAVHATEEETLIEIEQASPENDRSLLDRLRAFLARLAQAGDLDKLMHAAARLVFSLLQYDRVAVLRFDAEGRAAVVTEQKVADIEHWPEGDMEIFSEETRAKMLAGRLRLIIDADSPPTAILTEPEAEPLDLTQAFLRAASSDERALLRQSGAVSALAIALVVDDRLWGLVFCTHRTPRHPNMDLRAATELFGEFISLRLQVLSPRGIAENIAAPASATLQGLRVLILEDQALIAMDLEASLSEAGVIVASVCASSAQALKALESAEIDAAILDLHLHGETSLAVAEDLEKRGIPFIFATGQGDARLESRLGAHSGVDLGIHSERNGDDAKRLTRLAGKAMTRKPYDMERILEALREALADRN
jgi:CheY-like chemotaxis protein